MISYGDPNRYLVYGIRDPRDGAVVYVGITKVSGNPDSWLDGVPPRWRTHIHELIRGKHHNKKLQSLHNMRPLSLTDFRILDETFSWHIGDAELAWCKKVRRAVGKDRFCTERASGWGRTPKAYAQQRAAARKSFERIVNSEQYKKCRAAMERQQSEFLEKAGRSGGRVPNVTLTNRSDE